MIADIPPLPTAVGVATTAPPVASSSEVAVLPAVIQDLPEKLSQLMRPIQLSGTVTTLTNNEVLTLRTAAGDLTLNLLPLQDGGKNPLVDQLTPLAMNQRPLNVFIQPGSPPTQALILLPQTPASALAVTANSALPANIPIGLQQSASLSPGLTLSAVVLPGPVDASFAFALQKPGMVSPLATATATTAPLVTPVADNQTTQATQTAPEHALAALEDILSEIMTEAPHPSAAIETAVIPANTNVLPAAQSQVSAGTLRPGTEMVLRLDAVLQPEEAAPVMNSPDQIIATVAGRGTNGQLLLNVGNTALFVRQSSDLPAGSRLLLTIMPPKADEDFTFSLMPERGATALQHVMAALTQIDPQMAQQLMQGRIPQPNASLPSTLLFLFTFLQQGNVPGWLGAGTASMLERAGKIELISKLVEDLQQAGGLARDGTVGEWRTWPIPIHDGQQFQILHMYVHQDNQRQQQPRENGRQAAPQTRFLINLNMTRLGPMQMDGLVQKKQLDMIIRSERPLPPALPDELRGLYIKTLEAVGLTGNINFQTGRKNWLVVQREAATAMAGMVT
jgi:hypothetical protein